MLDNVTVLFSLPEPETVLVALNPFNVTLFALKSTDLTAVSSSKYTVYC